MLEVWKASRDPTMSDDLYCRWGQDLAYTCIFPSQCMQWYCLPCVLQVVSDDSDDEAASAAKHDIMDLEDLGKLMKENKVFWFFFASFFVVTACWINRHHWNNSSSAFYFPMNHTSSTISAPNAPILSIYNSNISDASCRDVPRWKKINQQTRLL